VDFVPKKPISTGISQVLRTRDFKIYLRKIRVPIGTFSRGAIGVHIGFTNEGGRDGHLRIGQTPPSRKTRPKGLPHPDTADVVGSATRNEEPIILGETVARKQTNVLRRRP